MFIAETTEEAPAFLAMTYTEPTQDTISKGPVAIVAPAVGTVMLVL